jgi:hypothetical protein
LKLGGQMKKIDIYYYILLVAMAILIYLFIAIDISLQKLVNYYQANWQPAQQTMALTHKEINQLRILCKK